MKPRLHRPGIARVDAVVLLAAAALLAGIFIPALAQARAVSNRERCANNLQHLTQATLKYADAHNGALPTARGILVHILPFTESSKLAEKLDASGKPWHDPANAELIATHLPFAQCPETPNPDRLLKGTSEGDEYQAAPTDYSSFNGIEMDVVRALFSPDFDRSSAIGPGQRQRLDEISDGLSTTLLGIIELADQPNQWRAGKLVGPSRGDGALNGAWASPATGAIYVRGYTADGTNIPGPCAMNVSTRRAVYSFHADGCNFPFADGSVRFLRKDLDVYLFYAISTRRGGELLTAADLK